MAGLDLNFNDDYAGPDDKFDPSSCHNYKEDKEYIIMRGFLQPNSTISLQIAAEYLLDLIPEERKPGHIVSLIHQCANVIPWHHTAHLKLAWLAERLRWSPKMSPELGKIQCQRFVFVMVSFSDYLWENYDNAGRYGTEKQSDLDQWVNFNAHLANLDAIHFSNGGGASRYAWETMAYAFKQPGLESLYRDPKDEGYGPHGERGRDATVVAAAQWILWNGQNMRRYVLYPRLPEGAVASDLEYFELERGSTLEHWQLWKQGFSSASTDDAASVEARSVALRAFTLMDALEKTMPS